MANSDLEKLISKIEKLEDPKGRTELMEKCCKKVAMHFLDIAEDYTPIDTGRLIHGWIGQEDGKGNTLSDSEIENYVNSVPIKNSGNKYNITISNAVSYAPYVNYGHRTRLGKKTQGVQRWVKGFYMLEEAARFTEMDVKDLVEKEAKKYFDEVFK